MLTNNTSVSYTILLFGPAQRFGEVGRYIECVEGDDRVTVGLLLPGGAIPAIPQSRVPRSLAITTLSSGTLFVFFDIAFYYYRFLPVVSFGHDCREGSLMIVASCRVAVCRVATCCGKPSQAASRC